MRSHTENLEGRRLTFAVNTQSHEVVNLAKACQDLDIPFPPPASAARDYAATLEAVEREPLVFGVYDAFYSPSSFVPIASRVAITPETLFAGDFDQSSVVLKAPAFDTFVEAAEWGHQRGTKYQFVAELAVPKERIAELKRRGLLSNAVKLLDFSAESPGTSPSPPREASRNSPLSALDDLVWKEAGAVGIYLNPDPRIRELEHQIQREVESILQAYRPAKLNPEHFRGMDYSLPTHVDV
jgi:hypothetical protein